MKGKRLPDFPFQVVDIVQPISDRKRLLPGQRLCVICKIGSEPSIGKLIGGGQFIPFEESVPSPKGIVIKLKFDPDIMSLRSRKRNQRRRTIYDTAIRELDGCLNIIGPLVPRANSDGSIFHVDLTHLNFSAVQWNIVVPSKYPTSHRKARIKNIFCIKSEKTTAKL